MPGPLQRARKPPPPAKDIVEDSSSDGDDEDIPAVAKKPYQSSQRPNAEISKNSTRGVATPIKKLPTTRQVKGKKTVVEDDTESEDEILANTKLPEQNMKGKGVKNAIESESPVDEDDTLVDAKIRRPANTTKSSTPIISSKSIEKSKGKGKGKDKVKAKGKTIEPGHTYFVVESILKREMHTNGGSPDTPQDSYFVKWEKSSELTWEPIGNLKHTDAAKEFEEKRQPAASSTPAPKESNVSGSGRVTRSKTSSPENKTSDESTTASDRVTRSTTKLADADSPSKKSKQNKKESASSSKDVPAKSRK